MRFKDVFSIIGPAMVGPSSSHTAGAVRLGRVARHLYGRLPERAVFTLYGSFADTYRGHGTDLALVAGVLDYDTDDPRIPDAFRCAREVGLAYSFKTAVAQAKHPNTVRIELDGGGWNDAGSVAADIGSRMGDTGSGAADACGTSGTFSIVGASIGGGNVEISGVDGFDVEFTALYPTLALYHEDRPGVLAEITRVLSRHDINIGYMDVDRKSRRGEALTVIEADNPLSGVVLDDLRKLSYIRAVRRVDLAEKGEG